MKLDTFTSRVVTQAELGVPTIRALYEDVYFAGLRVAGIPEK